MSEKKYEINDYKSAFAFFKQRFLVEKKSIFRLNSKYEKNKNDECCILTKESVQYLMDNFVNNGYSGDVSFEEKVKHQLIDGVKNVDKDILKSAIEILATLIWLWRVPPANAKERKRNVLEFLEKLEYKDISIDDNNPFFNEFNGFASTGTYYNTNKPTELAYLIKFLDEYLKDNKDPIEILTSKAFFGVEENENHKDYIGKMKLSTTKDFSYQDKKIKLMQN